MRSHRWSERRVDAYVDDELKDGYAAHIAEHVAGCPGCADTVALTLELKRRLRRLDAERPARIATARIRRFATTLIGP